MKFLENMSNISLKLTESDASGIETEPDLFHELLKFCSMKH